MAFKRRRRSLGCRARSGPKEFWQRQSQSMAGRSGRANSVQNRTCGRGGVVGDVTITSWWGCTGSIARRSLQSQESGLQARRRRVERKIEKLEAWRPRIWSLEHELMLWERRKERQRGQVSPLKKKGTRKKCWRDCMEVALVLCDTGVLKVHTGTF